MSCRGDKHHARAKSLLAHPRCWPAFLVRPWLGREQQFSGVGRKGFADEYFSLHLPYALAQKVFPMMKMVGWVGLEKHELQAKAVPFKAAILEYWDRLRKARGELEDLGGSLRKEKWDDLSYFRVQDACIERVESRPALAVTQLALPTKMQCKRWEP